MKRRLGRIGVVTGPAAQPPSRAHPWWGPPPRWSRGGAWGAVLAFALVWACSGEDGQQPVFEVVEVRPALADGQGLVLNQEITVRFSEPLDRASVTRDTVRVTDSAGLRVPGRLRTSPHSVTFVPVTPLEPTLDDGSFRPGQDYTLEIVGYPRLHGVKSLSGKLLERSRRWGFRAVGPSSAQLLWPSSQSLYGFALDARLLAMAADSKVLRLYFYERPLPTLVKPEAFQLHRAIPGRPGEFEHFAPASVKLRAEPRRHDPRMPGWVVELTLDGPLATGPLGVKLVADPDLVLRDAVGGVPPRLVRIAEDGTAQISDAVGQTLVVEVYRGESVPLRDLSFLREVPFRPRQPGSGAVKFEVSQGRAVPQVRREAGSGELGVFWPKYHTVLVPGEPFDRGDGELVRSSGPVFDFLEVLIPPGVRVEVRADPDEPIQLRACGSMRIEGELGFRGTPWGIEPSWAHDAGAAALVSAAGVSLVAGGDILVTGRITHTPAEPGGDDASPLMLLCGGNLVLWGRIPPRSVLATEPGKRTEGTVQGHPTPVKVAPMLRELPPGLALTADAETSWYPLAPSRSGKIEVEVLGRTGDVVIEVQLAPADPSNPSRPDESPGVLPVPVPLPLVEPLQAASAGFVRFVLKARVRSGVALPSIEGIRVIGR